MPSPFAPVPGLQRSPWDDAEAVPLAEGEVLPPNAPPRTEPQKLGVIKTQSGEHVDVRVELEVLADGSGGPARSAKTFVDFPRFVFPRVKSEGGKVAEFKTQFRWKGSVKVQTRYGTGASSRSLTCYGRGTTEADVDSRDITLGFHESCHRRDYVGYLQKNPLPDAPKFEVGMTDADFRRVKDEMNASMKKYAEALDAFSVGRTDEVGQRRRSEVPDKGCFVHRLP